MKESLRSKDERGNHTATSTETNPSKGRVVFMVDRASRNVLIRLSRNMPSDEDKLSLLALY